MSGLIERRNNWRNQLYTLTIRCFVNMIRDLGYFWVRTLFYILISLGAGIMYFDIGLSNSAFVTRTKCYTYVYNFLMCLSVGVLPSFFEEWKVSYHELHNGHYGEAVFMLSNFFASFIFLVIMSLSSGTIVFYTVKFHLGFSHYCYLCMNFFLCFATMESVAMIVALLVPNFLMGVGVSALAIVRKIRNHRFSILIIFMISLKEADRLYDLSAKCRCFCRWHLDSIGHCLIFPSSSGATQWPTSVSLHGLPR